MRHLGLYKGILLVGCAYIFFIIRSIDELSVNTELSKIYEGPSYDFNRNLSYIASVSVHDNDVKTKIKSNKNLALLSDISNVMHDKVEEILSKDTMHYAGKPLIISKNIIKKLGSYSYVKILIHSNIYSDARSARIPQSVITQLINAYRHLINFQSDVNKGNTLTVLFNNEGILKYSNFETSRKKFVIYNYKSDLGFGFCNEFGDGIKSELMKTPIDGARISSKFGIRTHPIYGYAKQHKGVDFAAPYGTPIVSAGDGRIVQVGPMGGYGKCITISHYNGYKTRYGHMCKYNSQITLGSSVKQGQVIGFVGMTGNTTGPHLHFEVIQNGRRINPMHVKMVSKKIDTKNKDAFFKFKEEIDNVLDLFKANKAGLQSTSNGSI